MSLDGTKIKAKTSMNKLTNEQQLKIMKQHLKESIELDEEDMELGEESGNGVPETLTDYITNNPTDYYELIPLM